MMGERTQEKRDMEEVAVSFSGEKWSLSSSYIV